MPPHLRSASARANSGNQSGESSSKVTAKTSKTTGTRGRKRKSTDSQSSSRPRRGKQARASGTKEPEGIPDEKRKPRLTTPDLEFDYDRSQLRDPRPTPGRVRRPRRDCFDIPEGFKERFYIPEPEKLKGRLNAADKADLFEQKCFLDPSEAFHDLQICHKKGREGSPTYDAAGFQLDWEMVDASMHLPSYTKSGALRRMEKAVDKRKREEREMFDIFFVDGKAPEVHPTNVIGYLQDQVSKDLGVPWHQIGPEYLLEWEKRGFSKKKAEEWWREPNETERRRMSKMGTGSIFRKILQRNLVINGLTGSSCMEVCAKFKRSFISYLFYFIRSVSKPMAEPS
ncbi:hypothetical protein F4813DRAFT_210290 [Daldinia decipiens]|uniref:uncharacterized protein n=1 Tax=Daldinia decipiens TaxID=326647 RepID=UPI0020C3352C|nr:uncharacterized protein F4813DRAFT_210290 [Daldinia decipiens]KAI1654497.1 hypothetical protein F4813DRAFT_210290 [Daldinia decipiens]